MRKILFMILAAVFLIGIGCAKVRVEGSKDPIKLDVSMRVDVYQHVAKDVEEVESIVSSSKEKLKPEGDGFASFIQTTTAAMNRKSRLSDLLSYKANNIIGENKNGFVEVRGTGGVVVEDLVRAENADRKVIYDGIAVKNNTSVEDVQKIYANKLQQDAPSGTPIQILNEATGYYEWKIK